VSDWLRQCAPWQYGLVFGLGMVVADATGAVIVQWLWRGHLNPVSLAGWAAGGMLFGPVAALEYRARRPQARARSRPPGREERQDTCRLENQDGDKPVRG